MAKGRRSMGTKKVDCPVVRGTSIGGIENREPQYDNLRPAPTLSALRPQASSSRLPRPRTTNSVGLSGRAASIENTRQSIKGRSSSSNLNQQNAFRTPRSTSRGWTPNGNKSGGSGRRQPLNSLQNPMAPRYSLAGGSSGINSGLGRSSAIGTKKEMSDKNFQRQTERDLVEFCQTHGYPRADYLNAEGSNRSFPLNSTEFKLIFTFLARHLDDELPELESKSFAEKIPNILKNIGYQIHVSKQTFQTLGTMHSWPAVLTVLHYLLQRAKLVTIIDENTDKIAFPNRDENGFEDASIESEEQIRFECFVDCYKAFNRGEDNYNTFLDYLENRFFQREGVNLKEQRKKEREMKSIREKLNEEQVAYAEAEQDLEMGTKECKEKQNDLVKMKNYCADMEKRKDSKLKDIEILKHSVATKSEKETFLKETLSQLKDTCRTVKNIDPDNVSPQIEYAIGMLEKQVHDVKDVLKANDNSIWQGEMEFSKILKEIEDICRNFNEKLIDLGLYSEFKPYGDILGDSSNTFKLEPKVGLNDAKEFLKAFEKSTGSNEKLIQQSYNEIEKELYLSGQQLESKTTELKQGKEEIEKRIHDKDVMQTKINTEELTFKDQLASLKNNVMTEKSKDRKNLNRLETELQSLGRDQTELLKLRQKHREEGHTLLTEAPKVLLDKRRKQIEFLNQKINEYRKAVEEKIGQAEKENDEMKNYVASLPRVKKDAAQE